MIQNNTLTIRTTTTDITDLDALTRRAPATDDLLILAAWLAAHGTAHLSEIELIELAERLITRRRFLIGAGALGIGIIAGCGTEEEAIVPTAVSDTWIFVDDAGREVEIPTNPQRIVTINDANTLGPLIELGAIDQIVGSGNGMENGKPIFRANREIDPETSHITPLGGVFEPNLETMAALQPDLIIVPDFSRYLEKLELYESIAPTVIIDPFTVPIQQYMGRFAELVSAQARLEELEDRRQAAVQSVRDAVGGDPSEVVVSMITAGVFADSGTVYTQSEGNSFQKTLKSIGFARPAEQLDDEELNTLSFELVDTQDGDLLLLLSFGDDEVTAEEAAAPLTDSPLWSQLNAVQKDQAHLVPVEQFSGVEYRSVLAFLDWLLEHVENLDTSGELPSVEVARPTPAME